MMEETTQPNFPSSIHHQVIKEIFTVTVFGYLIFIGIDFYDVHVFSLVWFERIYQTLKTVTTYPNTSTLVKYTPFSVFGNVVKHGLSCLVFHVKTCKKKL